MREIVKITIALTISCLVAGTVMGGVFMFTAKAKLQSEAMLRQQTLLGLLGYGDNHPAPADLKLSHVYRYILSDDTGIRSGYLVLVLNGSQIQHEFLIVDRDGGFVNRHPVTIPPEKAATESDRNAAIQHVLGQAVTIRYADDMIIASQNDIRTAYVLLGKFPGFKTFIHAMVALNSGFGILGMEITAHEEDPGLGGEIEKDFFKNQFRDRSLEVVKGLTVTKDPLPDDYRFYLEPQKWEDRQIDEADAAALKEKYQAADIHAISGATISSRCVTDGVRQLVKNFSYRIQILDRVMSEKQIHAAF
jgi:electron transport complex protein RnfG